MIKKILHYIVRILRMLVNTLNIIVFSLFLAVISSVIFKQYVSVPKEIVRYLFKSKCTHC